MIILSNDLFLGAYRSPDAALSVSTEEEPYFTFTYIRLSATENLLEMLSDM